jgi:hypothetical protein
MASTPDEVANEVLLRLGNLQKTPYSGLLLSCMNGALLQIISGRHFSDFRELQLNATASVAAGSGSRQVVAFSSWASNIWSPYSWHDETLDQPITPITITEADQVIGAATTQPYGYALWGTNLVIAPALSATKSILLRYFGTATRFTYAASAFGGTNPLPNEYDELLVFQAAKRMSMTVNPALTPMWAAAIRDWEEKRVAPTDQSLLFDSAFGVEMPHLV